MSKARSYPLPRRMPGSFHSSRALRRPAPYLGIDNDHKHALDRYEELEKSQTYPAVNYEVYPNQEQGKGSLLSSKLEPTPSDRRKALYQKFYKQLQDKKPADCVVLSVTNESPEYSVSLGQTLQERGLYVEMLYLHAESGLTRALQDIRADGYPLCILVEQTNIELCSCTVIIFAQSLKIHRNMPQDQALDFVTTENNRGKTHQAKDPADIAAETSQMLDDYLNREKHLRHYVPSDVRRLLMFLAEGVNLESDELENLSEYILSRQEQKDMAEPIGVPAAGLGKPPPLLPTPFPAHPLIGQASRSLPGSVLQSKPPPLMSKIPFEPPPPHMPGGRGYLLDTPPMYRGPPRRGGPPMAGRRPPLLPRPGGPLLPRPRGPLL